MASNANNSHDEIDIVEQLHLLWNSKILILGVTLLAMVVTYLLSAYIFPKQYQASSYISIRDSMVEFDNVGAISARPKLPEIAVAARLGESPDLLDNLVSDLLLSGDWVRGTDSLKDKLEVKTVGKEQLQLQASDEDPESAALIANSWANHLVNRINSIYGADSVVQSLEGQANEAWLDYEQTRTAWEQELARSQVASLKIHKDRSLRDLECALKTQSSLSRVRDDLQVFRRRLDDLKVDGSVPVEYILTINTLESRSLMSGICIENRSLPLQLLMSNEDFDLPVVEAVTYIGQLLDTIRDQELQITDEIQQLKDEIPGLESELAEAQGEIEFFSNSYRHAKAIYEALEEQRMSIATLPREVISLATVNAEAVVPVNPSSPRVLMNTLLVGVIVGMASIAAVISLDWWRTREG